MLSSRQWQDIRRAARTSRDMGVTLVVHGVKVSRDSLPLPAKESGQPGQRRQQQEEKTAPSHGASGARQPVETAGAPAGTATNEPLNGADGVHPMETTGGARRAKKQQRDAARREEFLVSKRAERSWATLTFLALRAARAKYRSDVWTAWMRSRLSPRRVTVGKMYH